MPVNLSDRELFLAESAPGRPRTDRFMPVYVLWWEAVLTAPASLQVVALFFVRRQLPHRVYNLAEPTSAWLFTPICLMVKDLVSRELTATESTPYWALILIAHPFVLVQVCKRLLDPTEATCLRAAVTTVRRRISTSDSDQADWAVIVRQVRIRMRAIGWIWARCLDVNIDEV